jgi:hypothetical protein
MADPFVLQPVAVQIASGQSLSPQVDIGPKTLVGLIVPSNWTTASLSFQASADGGATWGELQDQTATAITVGSITGGTQVFVGFDPTKLRGAWSLKVRSGTAASPVTQTNTVTLTLLTRDIF